MKFLKNMQNPFVLVGQGFILGGILFFATHPESLIASQTISAAADSTISAPGASR